MKYLITNNADLVPPLMTWGYIKPLNCRDSNDVLIINIPKHGSSSWSRLLFKHKEEDEDNQSIIGHLSGLTAEQNLPKRKVWPFRDSESVIKSGLYEILFAFLKNKQHRRHTLTGMRSTHIPIQESFNIVEWFDYRCGLDNSIDLSPEYIHDAHVLQYTRLQMLELCNTETDLIVGLDDLSSVFYYMFGTSTNANITARNFGGGPIKEGVENYFKNWESAQEFISSYFEKLKKARPNWYENHKKIDERFKPNTKEEIDKFFLEL